MHNNQLSHEFVAKNIDLILSSHKVISLTVTLKSYLCMLLSILMIDDAVKCKIYQG